MEAYQLVGVCFSVSARQPHEVAHEGATECLCTTLHILYHHSPAYIRDRYFQFHRHIPRSVREERKMILPILALLLTTAPWMAAGVATCYDLRGQEMDDGFRPCNTTATVSACCKSNANNASAPLDLCLDSGLCLSTSHQNAGRVYQSGCTQQNNEGCATVCNHGT